MTSPIWIGYERASQDPSDVRPGEARREPRIASAGGTRRLGRDRRVTIANLRCGSEPCAVDVNERVRLRHGGGGLWGRIVAPAAVAPAAVAPAAVPPDGQGKVSLAVSRRTAVALAERTAHGVVRIGLASAAGDVVASIPVRLRG